MTSALGNWRHRARSGCRSREPRDLPTRGQAAVRHQEPIPPLCCRLQPKREHRNPGPRQDKTWHLPWAVIASGDAIPPTRYRRGARGPKHHGGWLPDGSGHGLLTTLGGASGHQHPFQGRLVRPARALLKQSNERRFQPSLHTKNSPTSVKSQASDMTHERRWRAPRILDDAAP